MSLLALLAAAGGQPPPDPAEPEPPVVIDWPETTDPDLLALRPAGRTLGTAYVSGPDVAAQVATDLLTTYQQGTRGGYLAWDGTGPQYRTTLFLAPGVFGGGGNSEWRAVVGLDPENRTVLESKIPNGGVIHSFGSHYMENLHLTCLTDLDRPEGEANVPKYPWHITGGEMCIAANCTFDLSQVHPDTLGGGAAWVGADGSGGMTVLLYNCHFIPGPLNNIINIHGPASGEPMQFPMQYIVVNCTGLESLPMFCPGGPDVHGNGSEMWIINTPVASIEGLAGDHIYVDSDVPVLPGNQATIHRNVTEWPIPEGGLSSLWQSYFYPSDIGNEPTDITVEVPDAAPFAPTPGRTYYTKVPFTRAARATHIGVTVTQAAGNAGLTMVTADTQYIWDEEPTPILLEENTPTQVGLTVRQHYYAYTRYPGTNGIWHLCSFDDPGVRVMGSEALPGIVECRYTDDGVTFHDVPEGTAHPIPVFRASAEANL